jgi:hypothetical protein
LILEDVEEKLVNATMTLPTKNQCREWFSANWPNFLDDCGEGLSHTQMVEAFSEEYPGTEKWLDDPDHWIWDMPIELEETIKLVNQGYLTL